MSLRTCAALLAALFLLVAAPAAQGAKRAAKWKVTDLNASTTTVEAGDTFTLRGEVSNRNRARTRQGTIYFGLLEVGSTDRTRLAKRKIKRLRGGQTKAFTAQLTVPQETAAGDYVVRICARAKIGKWSRCTRFEFSVIVTPGPGTPPDNRSLSEKLRGSITQESLLRHMRALQGIADANGGNRASGFQGYGASVQYVLETLRAAGYNPTTQVFDFILFSENALPVFERTAPPPTRVFDNEGDDAEFATMSYSASGDTEAPLTAVDVVLGQPRDDAVTSGCEDTDFAGFPAGDVALIQRGTCDFVVKVRNAQEAGASAAVVFNQGNNEGRVGVVAGTLGEAAQDGDADDITIPALGTSYEIGEDLAEEDASGNDVRVHVMTDVNNEPRTSTNVLAETTGGDPNETVMVGGHLDSVDEGPGINDNGSGTAAVLEMAIQLANHGVTPENRIRFALWGAEESGLVGATRYMEAISQEDFDQIGMYLNFDMLASPNHAFFVYDGDFSDTTPPATAPDVNPGAARIESDFNEYFESQGIDPDPTAFDGRSDYKPFQDNGVPAGGLFSGAEQPKTAAQAAKWGGMPGVAFDPNYHQPGDTIDNLDMVGGERMSDAAAHVTAINAMTPELRERLGVAAAAAAAGASSGATSERLGSRLQK
jgi:Zn-dependent M28 family amino/carboxypeptidase